MRAQTATGMEMECPEHQRMDFVLHGSHLLLHWSGTLQVVALSLADAELHWICLCATECVALRNICGERNMSVPLQLITDASAATGVIQHQCAEMIKHLDIKTLWLGDFAPRLANDLERHLENSSLIWVRCWSLISVMVSAALLLRLCVVHMSSFVPQHPSAERPETLNLGAERPEPLNLVAERPEPLNLEEGQLSGHLAPSTSLRTYIFLSYTHTFSVVLQTQSSL